MRKRYGVPYTFVPTEEDDEENVEGGGHQHGNSAGSARAAAGTRASRVHSRSSNTTGGAREISINAALCNVPRDRGDQHTIYRYRDLRLSSRLSFSF